MRLSQRLCPLLPLLSSRRGPFPRSLRTACFSTRGGGGTPGHSLFVPGATAATIFMLGLLHARRMYHDRQAEKMKEMGLEQEFCPDTKAYFLRLLPLRSISRIWGFIMSMEVPVKLRPSLYKAWARAFHSDLEEAALPLEEYASLQEFFVRRLKEGARPIDQEICSLVSPVDGKVMCVGQLKGRGAMIEQVKGFSYSASSLLGANSSLFRGNDDGACHNDSAEGVSEGANGQSWWRVSLASPKLLEPTPPSSFHPRKGIFYCVIYLSPGGYHRVHSPLDWNILKRRHFPGRLFPQNERALRTIKNVYIENERVVLEGQWNEGFIALAAIGATNVGSIKLMIEQELQTNKPQFKMLHLEPPQEQIYEPDGLGVPVKRGEELAVFNMGSTVVLIFEAPMAEQKADGVAADFRFCVQSGDRVRVGEALGRWS